ncbi:LuxR C-terminal-related transcriptional regulator [Amnibacterium sp.]|uniref:helix-turn-helix transcriptional regulator n=1 Tax=Amnibacterium sp. TaxID=1872496 RepID=UPI003F7B85A9
MRSGVRALEPDAVLVDEASLLDHASAAFLLELSRSGVAVVLAVTSGRRVPDAVRAMADDGDALTVRLDPLDTDGSAALAAAILGGPVEPALAVALAAVAEGSPAAVQEVLRAARSAAVVRLEEGMWRLRGVLPAPAAARRLAAAEFRAAPADERDWLVAVAVAPEVADDVAERLCSDEVADDVERAGWTVHDDRAGATRMRRAAQAEAVLHAAGSRQQRTTLGRLLEAMTDLPRPLTDRERVARGAWRLELGLPVSPDEALELAALTALADPDLAERLLRHAVTEGGGGPAGIALAEHLRRTNRLDEAVRFLGDASDDDAQGAEAATVLALVTGFGAARPGHALTVLDTHLGAHGDRADLQAVRSGLLRIEMRYPEALSAAEAVRRGPSGFAAVFSGITEALVRIELGEPWAALELVERLRAPASAAVDRLPEGPALLDWLTGWAPATACLDVATAGPIAIRHYDHTLEAGLHTVRSPFAHLLGLVRTLEGDLGTAIGLLREAVGLPGAWRESRRPVVLADLAVALARAGDVAGAAEAIEQARSDAVPPSQQGRLRLADAELLEARGERDAAVVVAREVAERAQALGATVEEWDARFAGLRFGDRAAAEALGELPSLPGVGRALQQDHARALVGERLSELEATARRYWAAGLRWFAAEALVDAIRIRDEQGLPTTDATERLAKWTAEVPSLRSRTLGADPAPPLTGREREVVALAARGLTDRGVAEELGISVRTAQTHLARAFAKLGVHRRTELVGLLDDA